MRRSAGTSSASAALIGVRPTLPSDTGQVTVVPGCAACGG